MESGHEGPLGEGDGGMNWEISTDHIYTTVCKTGNSWEAAVSNTYTLPIPELSRAGNSPVGLLPLVSLRREPQT